MCWINNVLIKRVMKNITFAQTAIQRRIEEKQRPLRFQDFGYGDEYSEAPYDDYLDYLDGETYTEAAN